MSFRDLQLKKEYRSLLDDVIKEFYIPVLKESTVYKRAVGFFSSTSLIEIATGLGGLIGNGGKINLIASPRLSEEDITAINDGIKRKEQVIEEALLRELHDPKGKFEEARLNLLSNLIAGGILEIKIAFLENNYSVGMFHEKMGLMYDSENNVIAFTGSMNESANAFFHNYESIDVYSSWSIDRDRVLNKEAVFNSMWNDLEPNIHVWDFSRVTELIIQKYQKNKEIDITLDYDTVREDDNNKYLSVGQNPKIPDYLKLRDYQSKAIKNWKDSSYKGIFDMATGTGKTYTALAAIVDLYEFLNRNLAVFIVCPYQHLVEQWKEDIVEFGFKPIVCYSASTQRNWRERLKTEARSFSIGAINHIFVVTTNATFSTDFFQGIIRSLSGNVVLVVDEAHNFGAEKLSRMLIPHIPFRLALSATIDRHGDLEGTQKLLDYFGDKCIVYTLEEAIKNDMLTPYYYYPVVVSLGTVELEDYLELTSKIKKNIIPDDGKKIQLNDYVKMLLIKRARIVAGAVQKVEKLRELMINYQDDNQILVYCGATTLNDIDYKENNVEIDEMRQIDVIADLLGNKLGMRVSKFTSQENNDERRRIQVDFAEGRHLQALIAIRCLDEGVNIPSIRTAFILASSTNPKEYIQRRGRVLRKFSGKKNAIIFDFITLPINLDDIENYSEDVIESTKALAIREISRMKDFASIAENPFDSDILIAQIQSCFKIEPVDEEDDINVL